MPNTTKYLIWYFYSLDTPNISAGFSQLEIRVRYRGSPYKNFDIVTHFPLSISFLPCQEVLMFISLPSKPHSLNHGRPTFFMAKGHTPYGGRVRGQDVEK